MMTSLETSPHPHPRVNIPQRRLNDIQDACTSLAAGLSQFSDLVETYLSEVPLRSREAAPEDCERFLSWLETRSDITDEQRDLIVDQQSRHAVEFIALQKRIAHQRFLKLVREQKDFDPQSARHLSESVYFNPVSVWASFETHELLDDQTSIPATILFYSSQTEILSIVLESPAVAFLKSLDQSPQKLRTIIRQTPKHERETLLEMIADLIRLEVIALGA